MLVKIVVDGSVFDPYNYLLEPLANEGIPQGIILLQRKLQTHKVCALELCYVTNELCKGCRRRANRVRLMVASLHEAAVKRRSKQLLQYLHNFCSAVPMKRSSVGATLH